MMPGRAGEATHATRAEAGAHAAGRQGKPERGPIGDGDAMTDTDGLEAFCRRVHPALVGVLSFQVDSRATAEELARQALAHVWNRWSRVGQQQTPEAWAQGMALQLSRSSWRQWRARRRGRQRFAAPEDDLVDPGVRHAVRALPRRQREALALVVVGGLSVPEASQALDCGEDAVKELCIRARQELRASHRYGAE